MDYIKTPDNKYFITQHEYDFTKNNISWFLLCEDTKNYKEAETMIVGVDYGITIEETDKPFVFEIIERAKPQTIFAKRYQWYDIAMDIAMDDDEPNFAKMFENYLLENGIIEK